MIFPEIIDIFTFFIIIFRQTQPVTMKLGMILVIRIWNILGKKVCSFVRIFCWHHHFSQIFPIFQKIPCYIQHESQRVLENILWFCFNFLAAKTMIFNISSGFLKIMKIRPPTLSPNPHVSWIFKSDVTWRQIFKNWPKL